MIPRSQVEFLAPAVAVALVAVELVSCSSPDGETSQPLPSSQQEATQQYADCLESKGWSVEVQGESVNVNEIPNDRTSEYAADSDACHAQVLAWSDRLSSTQWQEWYSIATDSVACLESIGYTVDDVPSLQRFTDGGGRWSPYDELVVNGLLRGSIEEVEQQCPQPEYWPG